MEQSGSLISINLVVQISYYRISYLVWEKQKNLQNIPITRLGGRFGLAHGGVLHLQLFRSKPSDLNDVTLPSMTPSRGFKSDINPLQVQSDSSGPMFSFGNSHNGSTNLKAEL